jgi:hypothetical protein
LVVPDTVGEDLSERALGLLQVEALEVRLLQPLGANILRNAVEAECPLCGDAELVAAQPLGPRRSERSEEASADELTNRKSLKCPA